MPEGMNGTCYKGGLTVKENYQLCQVINRKIIDQLDPRVAEVTFSCNKPNASCGFQCMLLWKGSNGSLGRSEGEFRLFSG
jgi:hypothetical protein